MSKTNLVKRIEKLGKPTTQPRWKAAVYDESLKIYSGQDIGGTLTPEQFKKWYAQQDKDTQVIIVKVVENKPRLEINNYASENIEDLLKQYEEIIERGCSHE